MKTPLIIIALLLGLLDNATAQKCFYKGAFVLSANLGTDGNFANQRYFNGSEEQAQTLNGTVSASNFSLGAEYGLFNWLGFGIIGRFDNYYTQQNQVVTESTPSAGAVDVGGTANIHILRWSHFDMLLGYDLGFSHLTYNTNNASNTSSMANGSWSDIHATGRLYFNRLGVNLSFFIPGTTYKNFKESNMYLGDYTLNYWKSSGYGASLGLQYRLF